MRVHPFVREFVQEFKRDQTLDPFIVFTSNVLAILGLRSLYFLLARAVNAFRYLKPALGLVLAFAGVKLLLAHTSWKIDNLVALGAVATALAGGVAASLLRPVRAAEPEAIPVPAPVPAPPKPPRDRR